MDERKLIRRLAEIRQMVSARPLAVEAIDSLMAEMVFVDWPNDPPAKLVADPPTALTRPARRVGFLAIPPGSSIIIETPERP